VQEVLGARSPELRPRPRSERQRAGLPDVSPDDGAVNLRQQWGH